MNRDHRLITALSRPLLVVAALGMMAWALAQEAGGPQSARPSAAQLAHGHGVPSIREAR